MKKETPARNFCRLFLHEIGYFTNEPEHQETPRRIVDLYKDMFAGAKVDINKFFARPLPSQSNEMTVIEPIEFISLCEHHLWPFFGHVHIAYIPKGKIVGLSKFISAVRAEARRPQLQERMTTDLVNAIDQGIQPLGCMVVIEGHHTCMMVGGRYDYGMPAHTNARTMTSAVRGVFLNFEPPRNEAFQLFNHKER